jgi:3-oxoacyl-[acyl-carrier protein] reductase
MAEDPPVLLITGTSSGIGAYLARHYAGRGYRTIGCSRKAADLELPNYEHVRADVGSEQEVGSLMQHIREKYGRLDALINNAGVASMNYALLLPTATAEKIMATNFMGTFFLCREGARLMRQRRYGRIVNLGTVAVPMNIEGESIYAASKSAVVTFSRILAREVAPFGITVNVVGPTPIETNLIRSVPKDKIKRLVDQLAIKRLGTPADVANVIDFFLRPESDYITGQVVYLGGVS